MRKRITHNGIYIPKRTLQLFSLDTDSRIRVVMVQDPKRVRITKDDEGATKINRCRLRISKGEMQILDWQIGDIVEISSEGAPGEFYMEKVESAMSVSHDKKQ